MFEGGEKSAVMPSAVNAATLSNVTGKTGGGFRGVGDLYGVYGDVNDPRAHNRVPLPLRPHGHGR